MKSRTLPVVMVMALLLTGCSSSSTEESSTTVSAPAPAPSCSNREFLDQLTLKKINKNPFEFKGTCGFLDIQVLEIFPPDKSLTDKGFPSSCAIAASYTYPESSYPLDWAFDGIFFFSNCADLDEVYDGDVYKVLSVVDGTNTQSNGDRIAQFVVVETRVYENFGDRLIG
jgi:hypothetical protein